MAAFLWVEEGGVLHSTVFELFFPEVWKEQRDVKVFGLQDKHIAKCSSFDSDDCFMAALMF